MLKVYIKLPYLLVSPGVFLSQFFLYCGGFLNLSHVDKYAAKTVKQSLLLVN